jgi:acetyl esterase
LLELIQDSGGKPFSEGSVEEARAVMAAMAEMLGPGPAVASVDDRDVHGAARSVPVRIYTPSGVPPGVIVYLHGGGWVVGTIDDFDAVCRRLAVESGCVVVSVGYALAPEEPYPAAVEDADAAIVWAAEHVALGRPLVVMGDSAGATLAAVAARHARAAGGPPIALQVLVYPPTEASFETPSHVAYGSGPYLNTTGDMRWFFDHYVPDERRRAEPDVAPLRAADLAGLPPAIVVLARYDCLYDDGKAYAARLEAAGVPVTVLEADDQMHAFFTMVNHFEVADRFVADVGSRIGHAVRTASAT